MHESLQVQCIDVIAPRDNVQAKCTELVVIRARMSDLLWASPDLNDVTCLLCACMCSLCHS